MPMSILWGLENLNTDDSWTHQHTLTIHVILPRYHHDHAHPDYCTLQILGAYEVEVTNGHIFEEILHRLPAVEVLKVF